MNNHLVTHGVALFVFMLMLVHNGQSKPQQQNLAELEDNRISRAFYGRIRDMLEHDIMQSDEPNTAQPVYTIIN